MKNQITIGIPARNEESGTIFSCLLWLRRAVKKVEDKKITITVCLNCEYDKTEKEIIRFNDTYRDTKVEIVYSEPGIINAQRKMVQSFPAEIYMFLDGDSTVSENSISLLVKALDQDKSLSVAYAQPLPLRRKHRGLIEKIHILYNSQMFLTKRYYFHGRLFAIRDWYFPDSYKCDKKRPLLDQFGYFLSLDDIFLSYYSLDKHGINSIREVKAAHCYAWPIASCSDWYKIYRRTEIENIKVRYLCPEYTGLIKKCRRRTNWKQFLRAPLEKKTLWLGYLLMRSIFCLIFNFEFILIKMRIYKPTTQWETAWSTKKEI